MEPTADIRITLSEIRTIRKTLEKDTDLQIFFYEQEKALKKLKQKQIEELTQQVTPNFCEPGVNCE